MKEHNNVLHRWIRHRRAGGKKQKFIEHAKLGDSVFMDLGALRVVECWGDDVPKGKITDFFKAVDAKASV